MAESEKKPQTKQDKITKSIVDSLRQIRKQKKLTQRQLAERVGSHSDVISRMELGKEVPKLETLERIANALDVELTVTLTRR